jgi:hypothetical protein
MTTALMCGPTYTLTQNTAYALPARRCLLFCDAAAPTFTQSTDLAFTVSKALTLTSGQAEVAGGFIKSTGGDVTVTLKAY